MRHHYVREKVICGHINIKYISTGSMVADCLTKALSKMVYKYKRKTNQAQWSEYSMMLAIGDCNSGIPVKTAAKKYDLPHGTLYRHWKKGISIAQLGHYRKVFNDEQEGNLRAYFYDMNSVFTG